MGKLPMQHSVPNHVHWMNWLISFLILKHLSINVSLLKGCFSLDDKNNIWSSLELTKHSVTVPCMNIDVYKILISYKISSRWDNQQQYQAIIEASVVLNPEVFNNNGLMSPSQYVTVKNLVQENCYVNFPKHWMSNIILMSSS